MIGEGSDQFKSGSSLLSPVGGGVEAAEIVNVRVRGDAAEKFAFPAWLAVIEQVPAATARIEVDETIVQILVELDVKVTVKLLVEEGELD